MRGPSALGGGWRRALDLLLPDRGRPSSGAATSARRSATCGRSAGRCCCSRVLLAVFTQAFDLGDRVPHYPVLLLFNIVLFGFFQEATTQAVGSIVGQESVVRKTQFPRLVIPLAVVLTSLFNLGVNLVVVLVLRARLGRRADVDVAAVPAAARGAASCSPRRWR